LEKRVELFIIKNRVELGYNPSYEPTDFAYNDRKLLLTINDDTTAAVSGAEGHNGKGNNKGGVLDQPSMTELI